MNIGAFNKADIGQFDTEATLKLSASNDEANVQENSIDDNADQDD